MSNDTTTSSPAPGQHAILEASEHGEPSRSADDRALLDRCRCLEQQLREAVEKMEIIQEREKCLRLEFEQLTYATSHDLNAPLRAITGFATFLQNEYASQLDETAQGYIHHVVEGAHRASMQVRGLLEYSRVATRVADFCWMDCNKLVTDQVTDLQPLIESANASVTHDNLPMIFGDQRQIGALINQLIKNSVIFRGTPSPAVHVSAKRNHDHWEISVSDNGIGIPEEHSECVFDMYRRLHGPQEYTGVGAGLAICRRIVDRHAGRIWIDPSDQQGTTCTFSIPIPPATEGTSDGDNPTLAVENSDPQHSQPNEGENPDQLRYPTHVST